MIALFAFFLFFTLPSLLQNKIWKQPPKMSFFSLPTGNPLPNPKGLQEKKKQENKTQDSLFGSPMNEDAWASNEKLSSECKTFDCAQRILKSWSWWFILHRMAPVYAPWCFYLTQNGTKQILTRRLAISGYFVPFWQWPFTSQTSEDVQGAFSNCLPRVLGHWQVFIGTSHGILAI